MFSSLDFEREQAATTDWFGMPTNTVRAVLEAYAVTGVLGLARRDGRRYAGVIFQQGPSIKGLTTAASLWVTAAIGTAAALGYWDAALVTTVITVASLYGLKRVGRNVFPRLRGENREEEED